MPATEPKMTLGKLLGQRAGEWAWGGLGVGVATVSAAFAGYMVVVGPGHVPFPSAANFGVLAHLGPRRIAPDSHATALLQGSSDRLPVTSAPDDAAPVEAPTRAAADGSVDFAPTGSVEAERKLSPAAPADGPPRLKTFILRDVFDGKALVESRDSITLVAPGSDLVGAGKVLAIQRRGEAWIVTTSQGIITAEAR